MDKREKMLRKIGKLKESKKGTSEKRYKKAAKILKNPCFD